jgi:hypothetical protein
MTLSRFLLINETNMREMLVRYLCIHNPGVTNLKLWKMVGYTPSLEQVRSGEKRMTDPIEWKITPLGDQFCPEQS